MNSSQRETILILDFGSQYTQLIARRVRELGVYSMIKTYKTTIAEIRSIAPSGIILSGGPMSVMDEKAVSCDPAILDLGIPVLGLCYGMQLIAKLRGGGLARSETREYGRTIFKVSDTKSSLFGTVPAQSTVWMSHGDSVTSLPPGFHTLGTTDKLAVAGMADTAKKIYGLQFHPEVVHTEHGTKILENFLKAVCRCACSWNMHDFVERSVAEIKETVGGGSVVCALSGGVDSSVAATLVARAVGDRLTCVFVNNGVLRKDEHIKVMDNLKNNLRLNVVYADAADEFLEKLSGVEDPEKKRKIIGTQFIRVFEREAKKLGRVDFLVQGTLYPDVIESVSPIGGPSATIKSHHNVGGLPKDLNFKLVEPLKELFKDEVRRLGKELGVPDDILQRQPFPGPGLAVRIIGEVTKERVRVLQECDDIVVSEIKKAGLYTQIWQSFAVLLPIKTVGVMGDERTYENTAAVRAVISTDGMTADWARIPYDVLNIISNRIINEVKGVNRVVYDISSKPPATIEWE